MLEQILCECNGISSFQKISCGLIENLGILSGFRIVVCSFRPPGAMPGLTSDCAFGPESRKRHYKTRTSDRIRMTRSSCGFLFPFGSAGSSIPVRLFRSSETGAATWWSARHSERTIYPIYLYCTVCCGFVKAPASLSAWSPNRAFCPDWT
jgi:hypothetical protein